MTDMGGETRSTVSGGTQHGPVFQGRDFHGVHIGDVVQAAAAPMALAQLPTLAAGFTGRDSELAQITALLNPAEDTDAVVVSAMAGLAGVGKTALAVQAAYVARQAGWFPGGVLFLNLHGYDDVPAEPGQALDALVRALGVAAEHIPPGAEERAGLYRSILAQISNPVLIIVDNASSEAQVRPLLPGPGPHRVMVTSRHTLAGLGARLLDVTVLDDEAGCALLDAALRAARPGDDRVSADRLGAARLARVCGGLPLALQITAALLKADPTLSASELADELAEERKRLERLRYDDGSSGALSVEAAFELSYRRLNVGSARVFRMLPLNPGPDVSTDSAVVLADQSFFKVRRSLSCLASAHMIEAAPSATGRWRMHDLVRLYAQRLSDAHADSDRQEQARYRLLSYYLKMTQAAVFHLLTFSSIPGADQFTGRGDALAWLEAERSSLVAAVSMAARLGKHQIAFDLARVLVEYLSWCRYVDEWVATAAIGLNAAHNLNDRRSEAESLNNLGLALQAVRRFDEAVASHRTAAAIYRMAGDRPLEGTALHNLGMALQHLRFFDEAIVAYQQDLVICQEVGDQPGEGTTLNSLAICLQEAGQWDKAIEVSKSAAVIFREIGDRQGEGMALNSIAAGLRATGDLDAAITASRNSTALLREVDDRYHEALALVTLGGVLYSAGRYDEAIIACQDASAIFRDIGDRHGEGRALGNIAGSLLKEHRVDEAIAADQNSLSIFRETGDRYQQGTTLRNLAIALHEAQRLDEAIAALREAVVIFRETGDRHDEGHALKALGAAQGAAEQYGEAVTASRAAAAIFREFGNDRDEGTALYNLGFALREAQRPDEAISELQAAAAIFHKTGNRPDEGMALFHLAVVLGETEKLEQAITTGERAVAVYREIEDRHSEGSVLYNLGTTLRLAQRFDEAIDVLKDSAAIFRMAGDRKREGDALCNLSSAFWLAQRADEAITAVQSAVTIFREIGARQDEGRALNNLGTSLTEIGRLEEATNAHRDATAIFRETGDRQSEDIALNNLELDHAAQQT